MQMGMNTANDMSGMFSSNPYQKQQSQSQMIGGLIGMGAGAMFGPAGAAIGQGFGRMVGGMFGQKKAASMQEEAMARERRRQEMFRSFYAQ